MRLLFLIIIAGGLMVLGAAWFDRAGVVTDTATTTLADVGEEAARNQIEREAAAAAAEERRRDTLAWAAVHATQTATALETQERTAALAATATALDAQERAIIDAQQAPPPGPSPWALLPWVLVAGITGFVGAGVAWVWRKATRGHQERMAVVEVTSSSAVAQVAAKHQHALPPQSIHYAPHTHYAPHDRRSVQTVSPTPEQEAEPTTPPLVEATAVPTFAQLLDRGKIGPGQKLVIGHSPEGRTLATEWERLYSSAVGGLSGSGKSWTAANLITQSLLQGASVALIDIDARDRGSLSSRLAPLGSRFVADPADSDAQITHLIDLVLAELERRVALDNKGAPLIVAIDEYNDLARGNPHLVELVETIGRRGRRQAIYALCLSHQWDSRSTGSTGMRTVFASAFIHRLRPDVARMMTGLKAADLPPDLLELPDGHAYLLNTQGRQQRVITPRMTDGDVHRAALLLTDSAATVVLGTGSRAADSAPGARSAGTGTAGTPDTDAVSCIDDDALIAELVRRNKSANDIHRVVGGARGVVLEKVRTLREREVGA